VRPVAEAGTWTCYRARRWWILKDRATGREVRVSRRLLPQYDVALVTAWGYRRIPRRRVRE